MESIKNFLVALKAVLLCNRAKSLYWRLSMMALAGFCNILGDNLVGFHLTPIATTIFGLILGEVSKAINNYLSTTQLI